MDKFSTRHQNCPVSRKGGVSLRNKAVALARANEGILVKPVHTCVVCT
jgi:hypothetical protein